MANHFSIQITPFNIDKDGVVINVGGRLDFELETIISAEDLIKTIGLLGSTGYSVNQLIETYNDMQVIPKS